MPDWCEPVPREQRLPMTVVAVLVATENTATENTATGNTVAGSFAAPPWGDVDGHPLVWHAARRLREAGATRIVLVVDDARAALGGAVEDAPADAVSCVTVGRGEGLGAAFTRALAADPSVVLVHDPARAFAPVAMIHRVVDAVRNGADVVVPVLPVVDTIRVAGTDGQVSALVDRERLRIVQSPQGFAPDVLRRRYGSSGPSGNGSDDAAPTEGATHARAVALHAPPGADEVAAAVAAGATLTTVEGHVDADLLRATGSSGPTPTGPGPTDAGRSAVAEPADG
jgi:2-C-methyl-D-erythritol 4-phosphate cytidylyltransferase